MTYIQSLHDATDFRYRKELLNALHWMLQGHHHPLRKGEQWRRTAIRITVPGDELATDYEGPDVELLPVLTGELVDRLNDGDLDAHVLVRAAMAHLNLVKIHPWPDGNGRMSRMSRSLQTLVIARGGVLASEFSSFEEWLGVPGNTWEYYKVLREVGGPVYSPERDTGPWIRFNLLAYDQQTQRVQRRVERSNECWMQLMEAADGLGITDRQITALHEVAMVGRVRRSHYERTEALKTQQATRDLQALTKAGLLTAVGQTKGRHYLAAPTSLTTSWPLHGARTPSSTPTTPNRPF
ncbi:Fic family protein [Streptomyces noursei]|uniref:Fic family protein n=1 Tax=Streptomyces noursei TaxID=1971 RepID=UPI0023B7E86F|nr:Fic family protein [Streptomyces noursei]